MKFAITGANGFMGRRLATALQREGHQLNLVTRPGCNRGRIARREPDTQVFPLGLSDPERLAEAFAGARAIAHLAGINREIGDQTYETVHIDGARHVVAAARLAGVRRIVFVSFLRARPNCGSSYHESKWEAEEIIRSSGLEYTILKPGVVYGTGDHMLDHLSHAFHTFPIFGLVGFKDRPVRPLAIEDFVPILKAALTHEAMRDKTIPVTGPEEMGLADAVRRVAAVTGRRPAMIRLPLASHRMLAWGCEQMMRVTMVSKAQVRILSEGVVEPALAPDDLPPELQPTTPFTPEQIKQGLPEAKPFGFSDLLCPRLT